MTSDPSSSPAEDVGPELEPASTSKSEDNPDVVLPPTPYFDVQELDEQERNLVIFMSLSSYMDWQERFLECYKEVLLNRASERDSTEQPISHAYYNALTDLTQQQRAIFKTPGDDDAGTDSEEDNNEHSVFRHMLRIYRIDIYLKFLLLIFLLKLPSPCYVVVTMVYVTYVFLASSYLRTQSRIADNWRFTRYLISMVGWVHRTVAPIAAFSRPFLFPQQPEGAAEQPLIPGASVPPATPTDPYFRDSRESAADDTGAPDTEAESKLQGQPKPRMVTKALYQLFGAYVLSLLPWWEPNPLYLDESD